MSKVLLNGGSVTPAYGTDYKNKKDAEAAFKAGKDFQYHGVSGGVGTYCSIRDFAPGAQVQIRYQKRRLVTLVTVTE